MEHFLEINVFLITSKGGCQWEKTVAVSHADRLPIKVLSIH
jgi:hypothetical protein